jgi:peptide-methionine (R)-S-oxide reductase
MADLRQPVYSAQVRTYFRTMSDKIERTDEEWRKLLSSQEYHILREKGTERAFTGHYWQTKEPGTYVCAACGNELFDAQTKYESGSGWPSFYAPINEDAVANNMDHSHGMVRTETTCARCSSHLGHVFEDGPAPTGLRYCMNSVSLKLKPADK